jgi:hypothetical protein
MGFAGPSQPGVAGNAGRNVIHGPGTENLDIVAARVFRMPWEGHRIECEFLKGDR